MLSGIIAFQVLQQEPSNRRQVKAVLEKHAWYANQWQARLQDVPVADHALALFMQAARWADDIRTKDRQHHRGPWNYINCRLRHNDNRRACRSEDLSLTASAEDEIVVTEESDKGEGRLRLRGYST
jgi:hypothetical protein